MAAYERQARAAEREAELQHWLQLNEALIRLSQAHTEPFPPRQRPTAPGDEAVDEKTVLKRHRAEQRAGVSVFARAARKAAKNRAEEFATAEIARERERRREERAEIQRQLDASWDALLANDPDHVFASIEGAFEDNEMPAACIDVEGDTATLLMRVLQPQELIPERMVGLTPTGKPTHRKRSKTDINLLYAELMASHVLATVNEALAVGPGLREVRVIVIRGDQVGGSTVLACLYCGRFERQQLARLDMTSEQLNPLTVVEDADDALIHYKGKTQELAPLTLRDEPELRAVITTVAEQLGWRLAAPDGTRRR